MHYHIFGQNISQNLSPAIQNAAFAHNNLPHSYDFQDCDNLSDVKSLIHDDEFGGASMIMPHKLSVDRYCNQISDPAATLGVINTLIVRHDPKTGAQTILRDNTNWAGLYSIVAEYPYLSGVESGLVIKAGERREPPLMPWHRLGSSKSTSGIGPWKRRAVYPSTFKMPQPLHLYGCWPSTGYNKLSRCSY